MQTLCTYANDLRLESSLTHSLGTNAFSRMAEEHDWGKKDPKPGKLNFPSRSARPSRAKVRDTEVALTENITAEDSLLADDHRESQRAVRLFGSITRRRPTPVETETWEARGEKHVILACQYKSAS